MSRAVRQRESKMMAYRVIRLEISGSAWVKRSKKRHRGSEAGEAGRPEGNVGSGGGFQLRGHRRDLSSACCASQWSQPPSHHPYSVPGIGGKGALPSRSMSGTQTTQEGTK